MLVIAVLALNLMGVWAFAASLECGMECCESSDQADAISLKAPSCCQLSEVTCNFEPGQYQELFDKAICCHNSAQKISGEWGLVVSLGIFSPSPTLLFSPFERTTGPPHKTPVYLSQATFLC